MSPRTPDTPPERQNATQTDPQNDTPKTDDPQGPDQHAQDAILVVRDGSLRAVPETEASGEADALMQVFTGP